MTTNAPQVDVSTTLASPDWRPITVISSDVAAELTKLKQQPGKTNSVGASGTLVRFLLTEGLLDELNLLVHPVVVGTGMRCGQPALPVPTSGCGQLAVAGPWEQIFLSSAGPVSIRGRGVRRMAEKTASR